MSTDCTSTSVSLLYEEPPELNFAAYVEKLERALRETDYESFRLTWDHEDLVTMDIDGSRVTLGLTRATANDAGPGDFQAALMIAVGPNGSEGASRRIAENARVLCECLRDQIEETHRAQLVLWAKTPGMFCSDHFDSLVETALTMPRDATLASTAARFAAPAVDDLLDRMTVELERRDFEIAAREKELCRGRPRMMPKDGIPRPMPVDGMPQIEPRRPVRQRRTQPPARPALPMLAAANDAPAPAAEAPVKPKSAELIKLRTALYPPEETPVQRETLVRRLTIYSLNLTLIIGAMPIGAGLLTYNMLGRENYRVTGRVTALTGAALILSKTFLHHHGLALPFLGT